MRVLLTTLLHHRTLTGSHYDWLIESPGLESGGLGGDSRSLWTVRVAWPSWHWATAMPLSAVLLPLHRRRYLTYEGPVSQDRGRVQRVDEGRVGVLMWTQSRMVLDVRLQHFQGLVELMRTSGGAGIWRVKGVG